jgi:hypothetical protein
VLTRRALLSFGFWSSLLTTASGASAGLRLWKFEALEDMDTYRADYVSKVAAQLKLGGIKGWLHALLFAMNEPRGKLPSILILDAFNSVDPDDSDVNLDFIRSLYTEMNVMKAKTNIFVVGMTANKQVANKLCGLNGGCEFNIYPVSTKAAKRRQRGMKRSGHAVFQLMRFVTSILAISRATRILLSFKQVCPRWKRYSLPKLRSAENL